MRFAHTTAALHWSCIAANLYTADKPVYSRPTGVIAVSQGCFRPFLQRGLEQWGMRFAKNIVAVNLFCITADLYEEETFISVTAVS